MMSIVTIQLDHLGALPKLGLKGSEAARWLSDRSVVVPAEILSAVLVGEVWVARLGAAEFLIEGSADSDLVPRLWADLSPLPAEVFPVHRCDATFMLTGAQARSVFAQTCAIDFDSAATHRLIFSRVAGVSCGVLPEATRSGIRYRLWVELSYAAYLWDTLAAIVTELGGVTNPPTLVKPSFHIGDMAVGCPT